MSSERDRLLPSQRSSYSSVDPRNESRSHSASFNGPWDLDTSSVAIPHGNLGSLNSTYRDEDDEDDDNAPNDDSIRRQSYRAAFSQRTFSTDPSEQEEVDYTLDKGAQFIGLDPASVLKAVVFIEDAYWYRSIVHKLEPKQLAIYRSYQSTGVYVARYIVIFILHILAFVEYPSSLTLNSDLRTQTTRPEAPCWVTQSIELCCLLFLLLDNLLKAYLQGIRCFLRHRWDFTAVIFLMISLVDWAVSFGLGCHEYIRFRRLLRPFFIVQNSSLMKKIVGCLVRTMPEVVSVLLLLAMHLFIFTLFGMLLFPELTMKNLNGTKPVEETIFLDESNDTSTAFPRITPSQDEGSQYFHSLLDSLVNLLVLLTTANNPDVTMPAYSKNRFAALFFMIYLIIGLYCFMNMLLAVVYNQFRGYFLHSMQSSLLRRRLGVRAAYEVLRRKRHQKSQAMYSVEKVVGVGVGGHVIAEVVRLAMLPEHIKDAIGKDLGTRQEKMFSASEFQTLMHSLDNEVVVKQKPAIPFCQSMILRKVQYIFIHKYFIYFGISMAFVNLVMITAQLASKYDSSFRDNRNLIQMVNFTFVLYYLLEQLVKMWAFGWRRYLSERRNLFDAVITLALVAGESYSAAKYGIPYSSTARFPQRSDSTALNIIQIINILIMVRMFKIIPHFKSMSLVVGVVLDLLRNMKAFAGVLVVIFYVFAIFGMELFHGAIAYAPSFANKTFQCGTYEQLNYWANNFDDFFASIVVLWDVMVVNNWHVFLAVFREKTSPWSYLFFVAWWVLSVIVILNLFTALVMENFIFKWDRRDQLSNITAMASNFGNNDLTVSVRYNNVRSMFKDLLQEPADNQLLQRLDDHPYLVLER